MDQSQLEKLKIALERDEGFVDHPYRDSRGIYTFGIGFTRICHEDALYVLEQEIRRKWLELVIVLPWIVNLDDVRQRVLANMMYNLGVAGLCEFHKMLKACRKGDFAEASKEMLRSVWSKQVGSRAQRLALAMETGKDGASTSK